MFKGSECGAVSWTVNEWLGFEEWTAVELLGLLKTRLDKSTPEKKSRPTKVREAYRHYVIPFHCGHVKAFPQPMICGESLDN